MKTKVTIFNFIAKIKELEDQLEQTKKELETCKKVNAISNSLTGLEVVRKEREARTRIINEMYPKNMWGKEMKYVVPKEVAKDIIEVLKGGPFDEKTVIDLKDDTWKLNREKVAIYFRYIDYSYISDKQSEIIVHAV